MPVSIVAISNGHCPVCSSGDIKNATPSPIVIEQHDEVDHVPAGQHQRLAADRAAKFEKRDHRPCERDRADANADEDLDEVQVLLGRRHVPVRPEIGRKPDQHRRQPDKAVQDRHKLRHRGHLHARRDNRADDQPGISAPASSGSPPVFIAAAVATSAISIPIMPYQFPRRAVSCRDNPPRLKINNALAAMYAIVMRLVFIQ